MTSARKNPSEAQQAFSLIEVLVAIAIFSLAVIVLSQSFMNGLLCKESLKRVGENSADVAFIRQQVMAVADRKKLEEGGVLTLRGGQQVDWSATVSETNVVDLFCVTWTTLSGTESSGEDASTIEQTETLYLLKPNWTDAIERSKCLNEKKASLGRNRPKSSTT